MINAIIIDDEMKSRLLIRKYLSDHCPYVHVMAEAGSMGEGAAVINREKPDLLFLDIEMDDGSGFDLLNQFDSPFFHVIFITAHSSYAVRAFKYSAVDYVMKPVDMDDFIMAVEKVKKLIEAGKADNGTEAGFIHIRSGKENIYLKPADIIRIEGESSYSRVYDNEGKNYLVALNLGSLETRLDKNLFVRIHKSDIINITYLKKFHDSASSYVEMKDGSIVQVSRRNRDLLKSKIDSGQY